MFVFEGQTFRQMSFVVAASLEGALPGLPPVTEASAISNDFSQCSVIHGGIKAGFFSVDSRNLAVLTYTDGYDYFPNSSVTVAAQVSQDCPNLRITLDRSAIPRFIPYDPLLASRLASVPGYAAVTDPRLNTCGGRAVGLCITAPLLPSLETISFTLIPAGPGPAAALRGALSSNTWRPSAAARPVHLPGATTCALVLELAAGPAGAPRYFRIQTYGCGPAEPPVTTAQPAVRPNATTSSAVAEQRRPTSTGPPAPPASPATTAAPPPRASSSARDSATTLRPTMPPPTTAPPPPTTPGAPGPCLGYADLNFSSTTTTAAAAAAAATPTVLDCEQGAINMLHYPPGANASWLVGRAGRALAAAFAPASALGLHPRRDYVRLAPPPPAPAVFVTGADTDPRPGVWASVCLAVPACADSSSEQLGLLAFNFSAGPVMVTFVSGLGPGAGGAVLQYVVGGGPGGGRRRRLAGTDRGGPEGRPGRADASAARRAEAGAPTGCACTYGTAGGGAAAAQQGCGSPFFADPMCASAVATWPWLALHAPAPAGGAGGLPVAVDAVLFFERFTNLGTKDRLYVTATFRVYTAGLAHRLDAVALWRGEDGDGGACDAARSLASCARSSSLASPPTLQRQLCWAYTSALAAWVDPHAPGGAAAAFGSVSFCNDVTESGGNGTYYALLYSYNLKRVVAQVCVCARSPGVPERQWD